MIGDFPVLGRFTVENCKFICFFTQFALSLQGETKDIEPWSPK